MASVSSPPHTVEEIFKDYIARHSALLRALTNDVSEFFALCDPEKENLCLYGHSNESWEVTMPSEEVPPELPEPVLGINFIAEFPAVTMEFQQSGAKEAVTLDYGRKRGWITFPFIAESYMGLTLSATGWLVNLIVYLIQEFNVKIIDASHISNWVNGFINLIPIIAVVLADSFFNSFFNHLSFFLFLFIGCASLDIYSNRRFLRPPPCEPGNACQAPKPVQYGVLFVGIVLASIVIGGSRYTLAAMGTNQFHNTKDQKVFINWYLFILYTAIVVSMVGIAYVQENISWGLGFGLCVAANSVGLVIFLLGKRFYQREQSRGSPYTDLARVVVAVVRKRNLPLLSDTAKYYQQDHGINKIMVCRPTQSLRFLNCVALKYEGYVNGSTTNPWRLCTVEHVEDLKALVKVFPLWTSSVFLATPILLQATMTVVQALSMDGRVGSNFKIPAGLISVVLYISCTIFIPVMFRAGIFYCHQIVT